MSTPTRQDEVRSFAPHTVAAAGMADRIEKLLRCMTGASKAVLAWRDNGRGAWWLRQADAGTEEPQEAERLPLLLPAAALRAAEHAAEPVFVPDALKDSRFSSDPYFEGMAACSVLVAPVLHEGALVAMLFAEGLADPEGITPVQVDAVSMLAAQLAVQLDRDRRCAGIERAMGEQAVQLQQAKERLVAEVRRAAMAEIASNVLHNVGNVLTSVNVSAHVLASKVRKSPAGRVADIAKLLDEQSGDLAGFFGPEGRGQLLPGYLRELAEALGAEKEQLLDELQRLTGSVDHIKNVVAMQQSYAKAGGLMEHARLADIVDDVLRMQEASLARHGVRVERDYEDVHAAALDKTRVMQVLVNLVDNARQAMDETDAEKILRLAVWQEPGWVAVSVRDTGCGIPPANLSRIFSHGFTTKPGGHGFGLHGSHAAATEMGGSLAASSDGPGRGSSFVLRLPAFPSG